MAISNFISRKFGDFANKEFSPNIQSFINNTYTKIMKPDLSEFQSADSYKTLNQLFTRKLIKTRKFDTANDIIISPCDSLITEMGYIKNSQAFQIKGMPYTIDDLFTKEIHTKVLINGLYINMYLSPKDYHRYHSPIDMFVSKAVYIPGALYPVNDRYLKSTKDLFIKNERVILECITQKSFFYMVFVGALNVGQMIFNFDNKIKTNATDGFNVYKYQNLKIQKGEEIGRFEMGSTILMFFPSEMEINPKVSNGEKIKFAQSIGQILN